MQEMEQMHSLVLASEYEAEDVEAMWSSLTEQRTELAHMGVRHVVVYTSIWEPNRVFVTVGIRHRHSVPEVLRSGAIVDWFDRAGIEDIPAVFAGEVINKIDYYGPTPAGAASGVIVGVVTPVQDVPALMKNIDDSRDRFMAAGFRKLWVYGAFDDPREVMILVEISRESSARQWIDHADPAAEWMSNAGIAGYPPLFVGKIAHVMTLETCDR